jgi:hypothetical protein
VPTTQKTPPEIDDKVIIENILTEQFSLQQGEDVLKLHKITKSRYRLNFWGEKKFINHQLPERCILRSLWIRVEKTLDGFVCEALD